MKYRLRLLLLYGLALLARPFVRRLPPSAISARILVIKPDHLGDVLLATPALRLLRTQHPRAFITAAVGPWAHAVLRGNDDLDSLVTLPFPGFERRSPQETGRQGDKATGKHLLAVFRLLSAACIALRPYSTLLRYALLLRAGGYDTALLLRDDHWWGAALALIAGIPRRVGYAVPESRPFLTVALPWNPDEHVTVQALRVVEEVRRRQKAEGSEQKAETNVASFVPHLPSPILHSPSVFHPSPADRAWAAAWLRAHGVADHTQLVAIHPGTGGLSKLWRAEHWATVGDALRQRAGVQVLLTGGPGEDALVAQVAASMAEPPLCMVGEASVGQLAALLGRAALTLGVDSGPLHLAVAMGVPTIHLYGPGDPTRFGPWGDPARHRVLRSGLWCSPCGVFTACPRHTNPSECMERIATATVLATAWQMLAKDERRKTKDEYLA